MRRRLIVAIWTTSCLVFVSAQLHEQVVDNEGKPDDIRGDDGPLRPHLERDLHLLEKLREIGGVEILIPGRSFSPLSSSQKKLSWKELEVGWRMADRDGRKFHCKGSGESVATLHDKDMEKYRSMKLDSPLSKEEASMRAVKELENFKEVCVLEDRSYWKTKICHLKGATQFEGANLETSKFVYSLGIYSPQERDVKIFSSKFDSLEEFLFFEVHFNNGQKCDETDAPRSMKVQYFCCGSETKSLIPTLKFISETEVCSYVSIFCWPVLCDMGFVPRGSSNAWVALESIKGLCLQTAKGNGWFTFQVCIGHKVSQFHEEEVMESGKKRLKKSHEFHLGEYVSDRKAEINKSLLKVAGKKVQVYKNAEELLLIDTDQNGPSFIQIYENGSPCKIAGTRRKTLVKFVCEDQSAQIIGNIANGIISAEEISSCLYLVTVHTHLLCKNPFLIPEMTASSSETIHCEPEEDAFS